MQIWLAKSPHRYPLIPKAGISRKTLIMRIPRLEELMQKERFVFPIPLIMLIKVLLVYKNGHIHARVIM